MNCINKWIHSSYESNIKLFHGVATTKTIFRYLSHSPNQVCKFKIWNRFHKLKVEDNALRYLLDYTS